MANLKYVDYDGMDAIWKRIEKLVKKAEPKISEKEGNQLKNEDGLYVAKQHKLTFGPYEYDGSKDVSVSIYDGEYNEH